MSARRLTLLGPLVVFLASCDPPGKPNPAQRPVPPDQVRDFATLYGRNCAGCHGAEGKLGPAPPLNDPLFLQIVSDEELRTVISEGRVSPLPGQGDAPSRIMPAFARDRGGPLLPAQVQALVEGIKERWKQGEEAPRGVPRYAQRSDKGVSAEAGEKVFGRACAGCHGSQGRGEEGRGWVLNDPSFLALITDQALRRYIITGRADLGMPDYADPEGRSPEFTRLTDDDVGNLVALLASWRDSRGRR
jgi:cytochrome c oxidase cbb3-type subunit 3